CPFLPIPVPLAVFAELFSRAGALEDRYPALDLPIGYPAYVGGQLAADAPPDRRRFLVRAGGRTHTVSRLGVVQARGPAAALAGNALYLRLDDAARLLDRPDFVSRIDLSLGPGANPAQVRERVKETLGPGIDVRTPEAARDRTEDLMAGIKLAFSLGGVC